MQQNNELNRHNSVQYNYMLHFCNDFRIDFFEKQITASIKDINNLSQSINWKKSELSTLIAEKPANFFELAVNNKQIEQTKVSIVELIQSHNESKRIASFQSEILDLFLSIKDSEFHFTHIKTEPSDKRNKLSLEFVERFNTVLWNRIHLLERVVLELTGRQASEQEFLNKLYKEQIEVSQEMKLSTFSNKLLRNQLKQYAREKIQKSRATLIDLQKRERETRKNIDFIHLACNVLAATKEQYLSTELEMSIV